MLLDALAERPRRDRAISPDGVTWLDVQTLLQLASARAGDVGSARRSGGGAHEIPADDPVAATVGLLAAGLADVVPVVAADGLADPDRQALLAAAADAGRRSPEALLVVVTSGTTGRPRAVMRTARSWQASLAAFGTLLGPACPPGAVVWVPGAPASTLTLFGLWHALATGRPVIASGRWRADATARCGAAASALQCVPTVLADVLTAQEAGHLPTLAQAVVAGAAVPTGLRRRAVAAGVGIAEYYGAAELSFVAADPDGTGLRAFPGAEVAVRSGRIVVRSPYLALGYLPDGTTGPLHREPGGWAGVGDRGALSEAGRLTVLGRGDAVTSVGGHVVDLDDVERALTDAPGVAEVVAFAEPDERLGARVLAVVRRSSPGAVHVGALRALARDRLPGPARPVRYVVRDDLPRTPGGKTARAALLAEVLGADDVRRRRTLAT